MTMLTQSDADRLARIWKQSRVPVLLRKGKGNRLKLKLPYGADNYTWLRQNKRTKPEWNPQFKCWELPQAWFNDLVARLLTRHSKLYIIQPYREQEICAPAC